MGDTTFEALKGISLEIQDKEMVAIVGPSGSGKSTTMHILGLLDKPTSGKYYLDGMDTAQFTGDKLSLLRNRRLGFIFQQFFLLPKLSALDNVILPLTYRYSEKISPQEMQSRALKMLGNVDMKDFFAHRPNELSGGQQQRVAIARALVGQPSIILADEPTGALDSQTSQQILDLLKDQVVETGTTVVIITHAPEVATQCQRSIQIRDGVISNQGQTSCT